jgi:ABC-2 type transport system permease protein
VSIEQQPSATSQQLPANSASARKRRDLTRFGAVLLGLLLLNFLGGLYFFRLDLTEEKRYTMSAATQTLLSGLKQPVTVTVYLDGDFPPAFRRLQQSVRETLNEMQVHSGSNLHYVFVDPSAAGTEKGRNEYYQTLFKKGLSPTNLGANENGKRVEKIIFPWAVVSAGGKEQNVLLLRGNQAAPSDVRLNQTNVEAGDLIGSLSQYYDVFRVNLAQSRPEALQTLSAIIVAKPAGAYTEPEKFKLDQFITRGGNALFFVDAMRVNLDSASRGGMLAFPQSHNLDDLLFKYGVRVNPDLLLDLNSGVIPLVTGMTGNKPKVEPMPWQFYPLINKFSPHPITRNLDAVYTKFVSSMDTVKAIGIRKTPLLFTSRYTRVLPSPVPVNLNDARLEPNPKLYTSQFKPVGYLLEGQFGSLYANRAEPGTTNFQPATPAGAKPAKILVVSDGDFVRNEVDPKTGRPFRLGFDRLASTEFANRELLLNAVDYMLDESGLIAVRGKQITLRPLDKLRVVEERRRWQLLNLGAPLVLLALFGAVRAWRRKRRYARF